MRITDLLADPSLELGLETPSSAKRLDREIIRCAPMEHLDPTPFMDDNQLLLTSGIGMNFSAQSIWDGYVERLTRVSVSAVAFAVGPAHREIPPGLVAACTAQDVPLLRVPTTVPLHKIDQYVEEWLQAERIRRFDRGWALADECARLASQGAEITTLLTAIHAVIEQPVAVYDAFDSVIAQYPETATWRTGAQHADSPDVLSVPLPMGLSNPCRLAVRLLRSANEIATLLAPVSSILALQLNRAVGVDASSHQDMLRFVNRCIAWSESTRSDVANAFHELGLNRRAHSALAVADMSGEHAAAAWKLRVALHAAFHDVRVAEIDERLIALAQFPRESFENAGDSLMHMQPPLPLVYRGGLRTIDELRISLVHALDLVQHTAVPVVAPALGLSAVVAAAAGRGARESAERFLAPLLEYDEQRSAELIPTLRAWIRNDAQPSRTCEELFIHRNSLGYRLRRIEEILGLSLDTLEGKSTCLMALRLVDIEPY
ncbi:helix-turn-helix domain-containing protein [Leucobacter sp. USHLN153]|uniref:helix-turn-helix domain-containing protein n=1 Tax=Leucobacter sp. USHLN153 TaxID=3081268 RepID=UPI0030193251